MHNARVTADVDGEVPGVQEHRHAATAPRAGVPGVIPELSPRWAAGAPGGRFLSVPRSQALSLLLARQPMKPLKATATTSQPVLTLQQIETIFYKIQDIYEIHKEFYDSLCPKVQQWDSNITMGHLFQKLVCAFPGALLCSLPARGAARDEFWPPWLLPGLWGVQGAPGVPG